MPDLTGKTRSKYDVLSRFYSGLIISPVAGREYLEIKKIGAFDFSPFLYCSGNSIKRNIIFFWEVISRVWRYTRNSRIDIVVSPNPFVCGVIGLFLKIIIRAKVVIEVNGDFGEAFQYNGLGHVSDNFIDNTKCVIANKIMRFTLNYADAIRLLYDSQLAYLPRFENFKARCHIFSDFVSVESFIRERKNDDKYILLVGYPWFLKGVDILIKAFCQLSDKFPDYRLKIVGWCPEGKNFYKEIAKGNDKVELCDPVLHENIIPLFANCSIYVLASRTEAMGRVLLEAMACQKPIIASKVGGVPFVIKDGYNGLLFEKEDVNDLAEKIETVLTDKLFAARIAANGLRYVQEELSEGRFACNFKKMIDSL